MADVLSAEQNCPHCKGGNKADGGERCFHCGDCGWMTCVDLNGDGKLACDIEDALAATPAAEQPSETEGA